MGGDEWTSWIGHHSSVNIYRHTHYRLLEYWSFVLMWSNCLFVVVERWRLMLLADWISKSQHPQHTIAKTETSETDVRESEGRERDTHTHKREGERETRRARWRLKRETKQQLLGRNSSYTFCAGMGADFPTLLYKQHSWIFCPIALRVAQQIWDFTTVQIPHPLPPSPPFFLFLFFLFSFSFTFPHLEPP